MTATLDIRDMTIALGPAHRRVPVVEHVSLTVEPGRILCVELVEDAPMLFLHFDAILQASGAKLNWTQYPDAVFRLFDATLA